MTIWILWNYSGVSGEGCGVTIEGFAPADAVATPPAEDTKVSCCCSVVIGRFWSWMPLNIGIKICDLTLGWECYYKLAYS